MPRFAANLSLLFTEYPLIDRFEAASRQGFRGVEIQFPYELSVETIVDKLNEHQLQLVQFNIAADDLMHGGEGLASVPEKQNLFRTALQDALTYARHLKPIAVNVLPGCCFDADRKPAYLSNFKRNLRLAADALHTLNIKTVFEAINPYDMPGFIINTGSDMLTVLNELNHPGLFMQYDLYHMLRMSEAPLEFIRMHRQRIGHIQFADVPGRGQPGSGRADFGELFAAIDQSGYSGWIGAEYRPTGTTAASLDWFKPYQTLIIFSTGS